MSIIIHSPRLAESGQQPGFFMLWADRPMDAPYRVRIALSGTAQYGVDYLELSLEPLIWGRSGLVLISPVHSDKPELPESIILTLEPGPDYEVGQPARAVMWLMDRPLPKIPR